MVEIGGSLLNFLRSFPFSHSSTTCVSKESSFLTPALGNCDPKKWVQQVVL